MGCTKVPCFQNKICRVCSSQDKFATIFCSCARGNPGQESSSTSLPRCVLFVVLGQTLAQHLNKKKLDFKEQLPIQLPTQNTHSLLRKKRNKGRFSFLKPPSEKDEKCQLQFLSFQSSIFSPEVSA